MKSDRVKLAPGFSIFLRWKKWWVDRRVNGVRRKFNLHVSDRTEAVRLALDLQAGDEPSSPNNATTLKGTLEKYES